MTGGTGASRSRRVAAGYRRILVGAGGVLLAVALVPPLGSLALRYVAAEALQFSLLAVGVPALLVLGAPWSAAPQVESRPLPGELGEVGVGRGAFQRMARSRRAHRSPGRSVGYLALYIAVVIVWRVPAAVDALATHPGLSLLEATTLVAAGILLWLELVPSAPFVPRSAPPMRIGLAAIAMWVLWITGYLIGLSHVAWFHAYHHTAGTGLSLAADQQTAAGILWVVPAVVFVPLIFASLMTWMKDSEDPDEEMSKLLRVERRRSWWAPPGDAKAPPHGSGPAGPAGPGSGP